MKKVSVIITTYNGSHSLRNAIESVFSQTYKNIEVIVVDDNNPGTETRKETETCVRKYLNNNNFIYFQHSKNRNGAAARNTGLKLCRGEYVAFLDDDDVFLPSRIEKCVEMLEQNTEYGGVYSAIDIYRNGNLIKHKNATKRGFIWKELLLDEGLLGSGSNLFFKKSCVDVIGMFDERFQRYQDVEFMLRFLEKFQIIPINEVLVIKNIQGIQSKNIPNYEKYKKNKKIIFDKFDYMIQKLSDDEKKFFFESHYISLFNCAVHSCDKKIIKEALSDYKKINHTLTYRELLISRFPNLYRKFIRIRTHF